MKESMCDVAYGVAVCWDRLRSNKSFSSLSIYSSLSHHS